MPIQNALASVAVKDLERSVEWYEKVLGRTASRPMPEVAEWSFENGGGLQVYRLPERAGRGSCTLIVSDLREQEANLTRNDVAVGEKLSGGAANVVMVKDPDGNSIAFSQPADPRLAR